MQTLVRFEYSFVILMVFLFKYILPVYSFSLRLSTPLVTLYGTINLCFICLEGR